MDLMILSYILQGINCWTPGAATESSAPIIYIPIIYSIRFLTANLPSFLSILSRKLFIQYSPNLSSLKRMHPTIIISNKTLVNNGGILWYKNVLQKAHFCKNFILPFFFRCGIIACIQTNCAKYILMV